VGILDDIARLAVPRAGEPVVELGAGLGHLTARLLARGARVVAVERDRDLAAVLRGELGERITLLEADAARLDYAAVAAAAARSGPPPHPGPLPRAAGERGEHPPVPPEGPTSAAIPSPAASPTASGKIAVVGNLPYHLTSPILFSLLDQVEHVSRAVFLLQREVAERLAAEPGTRDWGLLSVLLQREADVSVERIVPPGAFVPPPKVDSAVLCAVFRPPAEPVADPARFRRLVKAGFAQRRKTLRNALEAARIAEPGRLLAALAAAGIDPARRGETLTVAEWAALDRALG
jgi:16S rRNA (adenine1518-N6/adenine1519-N6)-dimethyltransferase